MDVLTLSRLQFAVTAMFHFIFVPLTLGLSLLVAFMETRYVVTNDTMYLKMAKFWGRLFLINFILGAVLVAGSGDLSAVQVAKYQPAKLAAIESFWETRSGAPFTLFVWPNPRNERNAVEFLPIPNGLSLMAYHQADSEVVGLKAFPRDERPPVLVTFLSFRIMVGLGLLFILLAFIGVWRSFRGRLETSPLFLKVMLYGIPLSYIAVQLGWLVTEMGRQPWVVYGLMKTSAGVSSSLRPSQVVASLVGFTVVYGLLAVVDVYLLAKYSRRGPDDDLTGFLKTSPERGGVV
ncbi:MAG: cytochrome ubiquinol oxidase subunit I [Candidatus Aminicenantales bacterium]